VLVGPARLVSTAIIVGAGPNGLAAAVTLAQQGADVTVLEAAETIGGGTRSTENTVPGLLHDDCAPVVPIALASPFFRSLDLESRGLEWGWPAVDLAHPIDGDALPPRVQRAYRSFRFGSAAFKIDLAVEGGVPWTNPHCRAAGTVHVCGTFDEVVAAERATHAGRMPERPFINVAQQYLADPSRSVGNIHPLYAYAHVPHGYTGDATDAILNQIERFAPGCRDRIVASFTRSPAELQAYDANYVGGDIVGGANNPVQMVMRPRIAVDPYRTGVPGMYICSASTPPGVGVHGMSGHNAALSAIRKLRL
jgi:phytoene dehydrogenase-like protein